MSLTGGKVKVTREDGSVITGEAPEFAVRWHPAETHSLENIAGRPMRAYMIELMDKDWAPSTG